MLYVELGIVAVLIITNGLLAMSELAIVSSRPARLAALVTRTLRALAARWRWHPIPANFSRRSDRDHADRRLSGAFSGATLGQRLTNLLVETGWSQGMADAIGVGVVVTVITYASLIIGELVPKQIALRDPESVAVRVAPYMTLLAKISSPAVLAARSIRQGTVVAAGPARRGREIKSARTKSAPWLSKPRTPACSNPAKRK